VKRTNTIFAAGAALSAAALIISGCSSSDLDDAKATTTSVVDDVTDGAQDLADDVSDPFVPSEDLKVDDERTIQVKEPIKTKVDELGGIDELGAPDGDEHDGPNGGHYLVFDEVTVYWAAVTGAHALDAAGVQALEDNGGLDEFGYPTEDGLAEGAAHTYQFQKGKIEVDDDGHAAVDMD